MQILNYFEHILIISRQDKDFIIHPKKQEIKVIPNGYQTEVSLQIYSRDIASFICWWTHFVKKDLNGFSGFSHVKFQPVGFVVV